MDKPSVNITQKKIYSAGTIYFPLNVYPKIPTLLSLRITGKHDWEQCNINYCNNHTHKCITPANSGKLWLMQCWWQGDFFFLQITDITHLNSLDNGGGRETLLTDKNGLEHPHRHMCTHSRLQFTVDMISWFMGLCICRPLRVSRITLLSIDIYMIFLPVSPVKIFIHHAQSPCHCNGRSSNHFFVTWEVAYLSMMTGLLSVNIRLKLPSLLYNSILYRFISLCSLLISFV